MKLARREGLLALISAPVAALIAKQELEHDGRLAFAQMYGESSVEMPNGEVWTVNREDGGIRQFARRVTAAAGGPICAGQLVSLHNGTAAVSNFASCADGIALETVVTGACLTVAIADPFTLLLLNDTETDRTDRF